MDLPDPAELAERQRERTKFLQTDLDLCFTFADLAGTELQAPSDKEAARGVLGKAEQGYATIAGFLADVRDAEQRQVIGHRLAELRARLDGLQRRLASSSTL